MKDTKKTLINGNILHSWICWSRKWQPTPVFLPGKSHRLRRLAGYNSWDHKESGTTERECACTHTHTHTHTHIHYWAKDLKAVGRRENQVRDWIDKDAKMWDLPGSPVVKTLPSKAEGVGLIPGQGLPRWLSGKEATCQCRKRKRHGFDPCVGKIPWNRKWQPTPVSLPGELHG